MITKQFILFYLSRYPGIGGIETVTRTIVPELQRHGYEVAILSHIQQSAMDLEGVKLYTMPDAGRYLTKRNRAYAIELIGNIRPDAIVYQDSYAPTHSIVCEAAHKWNIPLYVFEHNSPRYVRIWLRQYHPLSLKGIIWRAIYPYSLWKEKRRKRLLFKHCYRYVLLAKAYIPEFAHLIGMDASSNKLCYINNPAPIFPVAATTAKENIILCVCQLNKAKGVDKMIHLWGKLAKELPDWRFVIVGDGKERQYLERLVKDNKLERVTFEGYQKPTEYYAKAKIFWMTSRYEGWPMTIVESMHYGCVPVAYDAFSAVHDMIDNERNGYIIPYGDEHAFLQQTLAIAQNGSKRELMAKEATEKSEVYGKDRIVGEWLKLLQR